MNKWHELLSTPGPGASTEWLRHRVRRLVAVELEPEAAAALGEWFAGTNVQAVAGDASALPYPDESFEVMLEVSDRLLFRARKPRAA